MSVSDKSVLDCRIPVSVQGLLTIKPFSCRMVLILIFCITVANIILVEAKVKGIIIGNMIQILDFITDSAVIRL